MAVILLGFGYGDGLDEGFYEQSSWPKLVISAWLL
jgi:hypothetical protein